jgi:hypothetical protein
MSAFDPKRTSAVLTPDPFQTTGARWYDAMSLVRSDNPGAALEGESNKMDAQLGKFIYWAATFIAAFIVVLVVISYASNASEGDPVISITPLLLAGAIWLIGWVCRNVVAGR